MKYDKLSRRLFLQGAGKVSLAVPLLQSIGPLIATLSPGEVLAAGPRMKYIMVHSDLAIPRVYMTPGYFDRATGTYGGADAVKYTQASADGVKYRSLEAVKNAQGKLSFILDNSWDAYLNNMNVISNTHAYAQSALHNISMATAASGLVQASGPGWRCAFHHSGDRVAADSIYNGANAPIPIIQAGYTNGGYRSAADTGYWRGSLWLDENGQDQYSLSKNLSQIYNTLVDIGGQAPEMVNGKKKIVDLVLEDYKSVTQSRYISSEDKKTLESVMDNWSDLSSQMESMGSAEPAQSCSYPQPPTNLNSKTEHQLTMRLCAIALGCGVSNVVNYALNDLHDNSERYREDWHSLGHGTDFIEGGYYLEHAIHWRGQRVLEFVNYLKNSPDANGNSVFDNSVLTWTHEYSNYGHNWLGHNQILLSGATDKLNLGQHVDANGAPIGKLWVTALQAVGLSMAQIERDNSPGFGEYRPVLDHQQTEILHWTVGGGYRNNGNSKFDYSNASTFMSTANRRTPYHFLMA